MATPAVPNSSYEVARSNLETLDGYINNTSGVVVNRDGQSLTPIPVLQDYIETVIESTAWVPVAGSFQAGGTIVNRNDVLLNTADSNYYSWGGTLPKVVASGSLPSTSGGVGINAWTLRTDVTLRSQLAAALSSVLVSTVPASVIAEAVTQLNSRIKAGLVYGDNTSFKYRVIAAVIRNGGDGWFIINDSAHEPTGLQSIAVEPDGTIRLNHNVGATQVGSLVAVPDETFAKRGLMFGGSIGTSISFLQITAPLAFTVNTGTGVLTIPTHLTDTITTATAAGSCTINHPTLTTNTPPMAVSVGSAQKTDFNVSFGPTQIVLDGVGDIDGYIRWDGANWLYTGNLRTAPTFSFSGGELTITHDGADQFNISLTAREDGLSARAGAIDKTSTKVRFYDATGTQVTAVSTLMKFYITRRARALKSVIEGSVSVTSGYVPVHADNVISTTGNVWLFGLMVV